MASILGGIGTSHVPTIGVAHDKGMQQDPDWAPLFKGYEPVAKWVTELDYPSWAAPVVSHGLMYIRGKDRLVCAELIPQKK